MSAVKARINEDGRLLIPAAMRRALGLKPGQQVLLELTEDGLRISTLQRAVRRAQQLVRRYVPADTSLVDALLEERRREADND